MAYDEGDLIRVSGVFTDSAGAAIDPDVVKLSYTNPAGTTTALTYLVAPLTIVRDSAGHYHADLDTTGIAAGRWYYRWFSTGTGQASGETSFDVRESKFV